MSMNKSIDLGKYFDYTNLRNNLTFEEIKKLCDETIEFGFYGLCVQPYYVQEVVSILKSSNVKVVSVADFPYGASLLNSRWQQVEELVKSAVDEIDLVMSIPLFIGKKFDMFEKDIEMAVQICHSHNVKLKVIIETGLLLPEEISLATRILCNYNVDFVKTSTGVISRGASFEDISIIKENISGATKIKASGGIKTLEQVQKFIELGVARIGASSAVAIVREYEELMK
ncbi:deoxyribose-phosphate aldolase [Bacteroidetes/Chlorobi group bacterium MS-B_bin-24]|nr:MAG: deoxyribose-phosphate aldolase [Bacteroidetes/Chlorobi group bacterium MS-B_bin-24]